MFILDTDNKIDILLDIFHDIFGDDHAHDDVSCQIAFDCPVCSSEKGVEYDGKGNLEINYKRGVYKCWACHETNDTHGSISKLINVFGDYNDYKRFKDLKLRFSYDSEIVKVYDKVVRLPKEYIELKDVKESIIYKPYIDYALITRGLTWDIITKFRIGACLTGEYSGRLIFPSYDMEDKINYFVARSIYGVKPKYMNPNVPKEVIVINEKFIDWNKAVPLVEGFIDHVVTPNSFTLLGKVVSDEHFYILYKKSLNFIIVCLDSDAWRQAKLIYHKLNGGKLLNRILIVKHIGIDMDNAKIFKHFGLEGIKALLLGAKKLKL
jgi:transcription elongation factor Elf1